MKLFCFDIDGTLMPFGDYEIPQEERDALQALLDKGHAICLSSGRPFCSLVHHLAPFQGKRKYYICANGAAVYNHHGDIIKETHLTVDDYLYVLNKYGPRGVSVYAYEGREGIVTTEFNKWVEEEIDYNLIQEKDICVVSSQKEMRQHPLLMKIMMVMESKELQDQGLDEEDMIRFDFSRSAPQYFELLEKGSSKGARVEDLRVHLGVAPEDVYCFGDQGNDISMVERFNGVAMGNAIPELKKVAKYVTLDAKEHGVVHALKNILKVI